MGKQPSSSGSKLYFVTTLLKSKFIPKVVASNALSKPVTSNSAPYTRESKVMNNDRVITSGMFRINPSKTSRVDNTAKTRRPQPRSNLKNDRIPSASKSSCLSNNLEKVEEHRRNLLFSKFLNHRSSKGNNIKLAIRNDKYESEGLLEGIHGLFSGRYCGLVRRVTCGYPWPGLRGNHKDFGMIQERLRSSAWCLSD
ncbi:hypothetical protein Tco_0466130 [Tanacetum coccineum]